MNENNPSPPLIPPAAALSDPIGKEFDSALAGRTAAGRPLGEDPADRTPITHTFAAVEALLRHPRRLMFQLRQPGARKLISGMVVVTLFCSLVYGLVVGTFSGGTQFWAAPVKIAGGLLISGAICLPSLYILTCLSGSEARFIEVSGLLAGLLTLMTVLLVGFAPVAWIFSQSTESIAWMGALHLAFWLVATLFGVRFMVAGFSHSNTKSRAGLKVWVVIFVLVALQMTTALRPILGKADTFFPVEKKFFAGHWFQCINSTMDNAGKTNTP
jgi:hypothetical protein